MNTQAQRDRNARKRAKLRAKKDGQTLFGHLYIEIEVIGCNQPVSLPADTLEGLHTLKEGLLPRQCVYGDVLCNECTSTPGQFSCFLRYCNPNSKTPVYAAESKVIIGGRCELSSVTLETEIAKVIHRVEGLRKGTKVVLSLKYLEQGQEVIERWQGTTDELEVGAAVVIAALL